MRRHETLVLLVHVGVPCTCVVADQNGAWWELSRSSASAVEFSRQYSVCHVLNNTQLQHHQSSAATRRALVTRLLQLTLTSHWRHWQNGIGSQPASGYNVMTMVNKLEEVLGWWDDEQLSGASRTCVGIANVTWIDARLVYFLAISLGQIRLRVFL